MYVFAQRIFPFNRSITGDGVRQTLAMIKEKLPALNIHEVPSGTECFDWTVPDEWNVKDAYIATMSGERVVSFTDNNLHLMGYSEPFEGVLTREELDKHLHSLPDLPDAIPYATSYYRRRWGFCISHNQRLELSEAKYKVVVDSDLKPGSLSYADLIIPGHSDKEILISTYTCHPSLANNEVSGPTLATFLACMLSNRENRYTYRIVFVPETIGPIVYLSRNLNHMKSKMVAGFVLTCVGDDRNVSFMPSRTGNTRADRAARRVLEKIAPDFVAYDFLKDRASDERQYCSPGADLPVASIMRTAYGRYPEYHTSLDDMSVISPEGFAKSFYLYRKVFETLEAMRLWKARLVGEPHLSKRNLRDSLGGQRKPLASDTKLIMDILALADGDTDAALLAERTGQPVQEILRLCEILVDDGLLEEID